MGLIWLLKVLQECVPDKFTREWPFQSDGEIVDTDEDDDDLSFVDPWNAPLFYVSTQQRRMVRSSISTMVDIQKHIGELPKRFEREHWPWETIRRKVLGEDDNKDDNTDEFRKTSFNAKNSDFAEADEEKKEDDFGATHFGDISSDALDDENITNSPNTVTSDGIDYKGSPKKEEKQLCIGSIFGMDVGGTLAKLVYFEKKAVDLDPIQTRNLREKHYAKSVSAKSVFMANRHSNSNLPYHFTAKPLTSKRSTSMSPMRSLSSPVMRTRSSTIDEWEFQDDEEIVTWNPLLRRRTVSISESPSVKTKDNGAYLPEPESPVYEKQQQHEEDKGPRTLPLHESLNKRSSEDLKYPHSIRQQSLSDDYQHSVAFRTNSSSIEEAHERQKFFGSDSKESTEYIPESKSDDDENDSQGNPPKFSLSPSTSEWTPASGNTNFLMNRSLSMLDMSTQQHDRQKAEALNQFYDFARRLDANEDSISDIQLSFYCRELGGEFHFISYETRKMKNVMNLIRVNNLHMNIRNMGATGGGAHKFADLWEQELGIGMIKQDELYSLVAGMQFVLSTVVGECFTFRPREETTLMEENEIESITDAPQSDNESNESKLDPEMSRPENDHSSSKPKPQIYKQDRWTRKVQRDAISYSSAYPYMLVTIGTGVSVLRVDGPRKHERVSGSTIGGGTFWGLMRLLTDVEKFEDAMKQAEKGDPTKVDMMVGDIYGEDSDALEKLGLTADIVASSFGKLVSKENPAKGLTQEDLARALLSLVTNNIGQVAYLNAKLHNTPRIYFVGSFLRHNMISQRRLSFAIDYWSKGTMEALFLEHEGYFGALGAFLMTQNIEKRNSGFFRWKNDP